jgi:uncharacterized protein
MKIMTKKRLHGPFVLALISAGLCIGSGPAAAQADHQRRGHAIGEDFSFVNGSTRLHGSLLLPTGPGPHPAFVAIEGSGDWSYRRSWVPGRFPFWKDIAEFLVARGYAVLLFDKPGVNESTGDWRRQSFEDRADEVISAVRRLAARDDIDPTRVGLVGHSQGGWIAQIAGARQPDAVSFLILLAGPAVSVNQQIQDDSHGVWACRGVSRIGNAVRRPGLRVGLGILGLVARVAKPGYLSRIINFDPQSVLPDIPQPTLAVFAGNDYLVEAETNRDRLERYFGTHRGNRRLVTATVPGADHFFRTSPQCPGERPATEWAPGFFEALEDVEYWNWVEDGEAARGGGSQSGGQTALERLSAPATCCWPRSWGG